MAASRGKNSPGYDNPFLADDSDSDNPVISEIVVEVRSVLERIPIHRFGTGNPLEAAFKSATVYVAENSGGNLEGTHVQFAYENFLYHVSSERMEK